jgi:branched-chain amino acid transport system ATP-binding protein
MGSHSAGAGTAQSVAGSGHPQFEAASGGPYAAAGREHPLLSVQSASKSFRGLRAVAEASLEVREGEIVALIGPNGAGKTTLFNLIAGALVPDTGSIRFMGRDIAGLRPDQVSRGGRRAHLPDRAAVRRHDSYRERDGGRLLGTRDTGVAHDRAELALRSLNMWDLRDRPASSLTLPDRKRLEVARALATQPKLLLLDEVMAGLRPTETDEMVAAFRRLNAESGITILLIEHVMRAVMALAQRVYVLHHGEIISYGTPAEVTRDPKVLHSYLGAEEV